jgi:phage-related protein
MAWDILFYDTPNKKTPVSDFLKSLSLKPRAKCSKYIQMLENNGLRLPSQYLEKVRGDIWALRPEYGGNEYRLFFFRTSKNRFVITHAILKNTRRLKLSDIETAENRRTDWLSRHKTEVTT